MGREMIMIVLSGKMEAKSSYSFESVLVKYSILISSECHDHFLSHITCLEGNTWRHRAQHDVINVATDFFASNSIQEIFGRTV
jgi:hypothetical protein